VVRQSGGTSGVELASGAGVTWKRLLYFGQPLHAESTGGNASIVANIPGVFKFARVFNLESNPENNTAVVGGLRASFTF
jgi:hypothetical protein